MLPVKILNHEFKKLKSVPLKSLVIRYHGTMLCFRIKILKKKNNKALIFCMLG